MAECAVADERNNQCYYSSNIDCKKMLLVCVKKDKKYNKPNKKDRIVGYSGGVMLQ